MSQGRGNAAQASNMVGFGVIFCLCLLLLIKAKPTHGAIYTVGESAGWGFNVNSWPKGKSFKAGDLLVFNYDSSIHVVVQVDKRGYHGCVSPKAAKVYSTGNDRVSLVKGMNYFICSFPGHCQAGMKLAINAT
ncbi:hypothetical protein Dimus_024237 [Dionaea muscipula]